ncbi:MAG: histidine phosphatase family protein [Gammaproteobacteria bacterium]|nr:histidine phosphatase family protein [Gammaproteobacteria bacterium]
MRVIGLRHGQSRYNVDGLCNDDDRRAVDLTPQGVAQAEAAATALRNAALAQVFCSPLLRARRTAAIVADALGLDVTVEPRLADIRSGFDGRPVADYLQAIAADPVGMSVNGGESLRDYRLRVDGFVDELLQRGVDDLLLVAHEETLRVLAARCDGLPLADQVGRPFANCVPYEFHVSSAN